MCFVDGENLTARAQSVAKNLNIALTDGPYYCRNCFLWFPNTSGRQNISALYGSFSVLTELSIRSSYYTSIEGDELRRDEIIQRLRELQFDPAVYKRTRKGAKAKGVDIALTKDLLSHAFRDNFDTAVLVAGDGDYLPLVEEVKRLGKRVHVWFFADDGLNPRLRLTSDEFLDLTPEFRKAWQDRTDER